MALGSTDDDTEEWIAKLKQIISRLINMETTHTEEYLLLHILSNLSEEYNNTVEYCEEALKSRNLMLKSVMTRLSAKYKRLNKGFDKRADKDILVMEQERK